MRSQSSREGIQRQHRHDRNSAERSKTGSYFGTRPRPSLIQVTNPVTTTIDDSPGVMYLRDPRSLVYNFDPYLENIMPTDEFDYDALYEFITSSRDTTLVSMAKECNANYVGSTSSMTGVMSHFHFLLSAWRPVNIDMLSTVYATQFRTFTAITRAPAGIFLRYKGDGIYAIDADKMYETDDTVLTWLVLPLKTILKLGSFNGENVDTTT